MDVQVLEIQRLPKQVVKGVTLRRTDGGYCPLDWYTFSPEVEDAVLYLQCLEIGTLSLRIVYGVDLSMEMESKV